MPLYQYKCKEENCKHSFERLVMMSARDAQDCPRCHKRAVRDGFQGFSVTTPFDLSTKDPYTDKEIDKVVGEDANKKWEAFEKKTRKKLEGANVVTLDIKPGEKFNSEALIGDASRREKSRMYADAVTEHKKQVIAEGKDPNAWDKTGFKKLNV